MFEYLPGDSLLHRLDVRTKSLGFLAATVLIFLFTFPLYNLALAIFSFGLALYVGLTIDKVIEKIRPLVAIFILVILLTGISYPPERYTTPLAQHVILRLHPQVILTTGGLLLGVTYLFRILVMVLLSSTLIYCTPIQDFLQLLQMLRMPYQLAFVLTTAIRFVPSMERKTANIIDAQKARGAQIGVGGMFGRIRTYVPVMVPMLVEAVRISESLAISMLNRGYGATEKATPLNELHMGTLDLALSVLFILAMVAAIYLRTQGVGIL
ncbi:MAG TPA: energy-coupling factor transporter transmembrane component T [Anaerolineales bacterium]|nr:energy-coupling factor transporter transmembrane component T [Anaerolineales bacterium]